MDEGGRQGQRKRAGVIFASRRTFLCDTDVSGTIMSTTQWVEDAILGVSKLGIAYKKTVFTVRYTYDLSTTCQAHRFLAGHAQSP